ncbi:uncharacterized protein [Apostichopus japonicus]|uniref:uncharacterized protein isoform X2 n=1 Tax=Stichopus japonicus TaxID=307972 RepID=UPI003AB35BF5
MTSPRGHSGSRTLGNVKVKGTVFPPLTRAVNDSSRQYFVEHQLMVQGDSMGLPSFITKSIERNDTPQRATPRPVTSKPENANSKLVEDIKELQTREKQSKNKIQSLQKIIEQLKQDVKSRDADLASINQKLAEIEEQYKKLYEEEQADHIVTKDKLKGISQELQEKNEFVEELKRKHEESMQEIKTRYEEKLKDLQEEKVREVKERDERIEKMKKQMVGFLKDNSWERQQQLEELTKELGKVSEEAMTLKIKLKSLLRNNQCERCDLLKQDIVKRDRKIAEQEISIKELMTVCKKFEKQLMQQAILRQCADLVNKAP